MKLYAMNLTHKFQAKEGDFLTGPCISISYGTKDLIQSFEINMDQKLYPFARDHCLLSLASRKVH